MIAEPWTLFRWIAVSRVGLGTVGQPGQVGSIGYLLVLGSTHGGIG